MSGQQKYRAQTRRSLATPYPDASVRLCTIGARNRPIPHSNRIHGFSMIEALLAMSITAIAGGALLSSLGAAVNASTHTAHVAIARGLASQLMDEIAAAPFPAATNITLSPGVPRSEFDDIDDFHNWSMSPPLDRNGWKIGFEGVDNDGYIVPRDSKMQADASLLEHFRRRVTVERVVHNQPDGWSVVVEHTEYRRVFVSVDYTDARGLTTTLWEAGRIFSDVPFTP